MLKKRHEGGIVISFTDKDTEAYKCWVKSDNKWGSQNLNPGSLTTEPVLSNKILNTSCKIKQSDDAAPKLQVTTQCVT